MTCVRMDLKELYDVKYIVQIRRYYLLVIHLAAAVGFEIALQRAALSLMCGGRTVLREKC